MSMTIMAPIAKPAASSSKTVKTTAGKNTESKKLFPGNISMDEVGLKNVTIDGAKFDLYDLNVYTSQNGRFLSINFTLLKRVKSFSGIENFGRRKYSFQLAETGLIIHLPKNKDRSVALTEAKEILENIIASQQKSNSNSENAQKLLEVLQRIQ